MDKGTNLHPSVQQFKQFVKEHPLLIKEVRNGYKTWQELYEEWMIVGEHHINWEAYKKREDHVQENNQQQEEKNASSSAGSESSSSDVVNSLLGLAKNINFNDLQGHITQFSSALQNIQQLVKMFQSSKQTPEQHQSQQYDPFSFRRH